MPARVMIARRVEIVATYRTDELDRIPTGARPNAATNSFGGNDLRHAAQQHADRI